MFIIFESMSEQQVSRTRAVKRIAPNTRVSGSFGDFIPNVNPAVKRRKHLRIYGNVLCAVDRGKYRVQFDNETIQECYSNSLS